MVEYLVTILTFTGIYAMIALGLNIQWGMTGLINLGQVAFFAIGAYCSALLLGAGVPFIGAVIAAGLLAGIFGVVVALLTPQLKEDYLAIVTLGFSALVRLIFLNEKWIGNGPDGINSIEQPLRTEFPAHYNLFFLAITIGVVLLMFALSTRIARFPLGRVLRAIREDEVVVDSLGKPSLLFKSEAFAIGAVFAGVGGAFYASFMTFIAPAMFTAHVSVYVLAAVLIGTQGSSIWTIVGVTVVSFLLDGTQLLKDYIPFVHGVQLAALRLMLLGAGLMAIVLVRYKTPVRARR